MEGSTLWNVLNWKGFLILIAFLLITRIPTYTYKVTVSLLNVDLSTTNISNIRNEDSSPDPYAIVMVFVLKLTGIVIVAALFCKHCTSDRVLQMECRREWNLLDWKVFEIRCLISCLLMIRIPPSNNNVAFALLNVDLSTTNISDISPDPIVTVVLSVCVVVVTAGVGALCRKRWSRVIQMEGPTEMNLLDWKVSGPVVFLLVTLIPPCNNNVSFALLNIDLSTTNIYGNADFLLFLIVIVDLSVRVSIIAVVVGMLCYSLRPRSP